MTRRHGHLPQIAIGLAVTSGKVSLFGVMKPGPRVLKGVNSRDGRNPGIQE